MSQPIIITNTQLQQYIEQIGVENFLGQVEQVFRQADLDTKYQENSELNEQYGTVWRSLNSLRNLIFTNSKGASS